MQKHPRVHTEPARAHTEEAKSCAVPQRASVGDAEGQKVDAEATVAAQRLVELT